MTHAPVEYTVESRKPFDEAVKAVEEQSAAKGFGVLHTHDVAGTLAAKGFRREPLKIVEICNARLANEALAKDPRLSLMLPCPISVYTQGWQDLYQHAPAVRNSQLLSGCRGRIDRG